jgi:hypothetical protein
MTTSRAVAYLMGKPKEDNSMPAKRESRKVCTIVRPVSPVCMVRLNCQIRVRLGKRSTRHTVPVVTPCDICERSRRIEGSPQGKAISEMVKRTKGHLTTLNVQRRVNAGSSKGRESYDDGTPIVVSNDKGAAPEGGPESSPDQRGKGR